VICKPSCGVGEDLYLCILGRVGRGKAACVSAGGGGMGVLVGDEEARGVRIVLGECTRDVEV
jgi:hypothetical protein